MRLSCLHICASLVSASFASLAAFAGTGSLADPVTTVDELTNALWKARGNGVTVYLKPGFYDVSKIHMKHNNAKTGGEESDPVSHLAVDRCVLSGSSSDPSDVVIYGDKSDRILYCWCGTVQYLTLSNGCAQADAYDGGGGICGRNSGTTANHLIVTDCEAPYGGGVRCVKCDAVSVLNCHATKSGGGVYSPYDSPKFYDGVIRNCTADVSGRGAAGSLDLQRCEISGNTCSTAAGYGGGVSGVDRTCKVKDCTIFGNKGWRGGGVGLYADVTGGVVSNNTATLYGGGIYSGNSNERVTATNVLMIANRAESSGGGLYNCKAAYDCRIVDNYAELYGGGCNDCILYGGIVSNNVACADGGGLNGGQAYGVDIVFNLLSNTTSSASYGAGVYNSAMISNCVLAGNAIVDHASRDGSGGAGRDSTFRHCRIYNNYATLGAAAEASSFFDCLVSNNVASAKYRHYTMRNLTCVDGCDVCGELIDTPKRVVDTKFHGTRSTWTLPEGANVYTNGSFDAKNDYLIYNSQGTGTCFTNCLFYDNVASSSVIYRPTGEVTLPIVNCTFADNRIANLLLGFDATHPCEVINSIFERNTKDDGTTPGDFRYSQGNNITLENCLVGLSSKSEAEALTHSNVIFSDLVRFDSGNATDPYSIRWPSKARGNGKVMPWMASATDIRRDAAYPRLRDNSVDIGCYQCWLPVPGLSVIVR